MTKQCHEQNTLRIAALIRVSTERQEQLGESLRAQRTAVERAAEAVGGKVVEWYGGQEHATPGHEKAHVNRLLGDAAAGRVRRRDGGARGPVEP